jgi:hypothetical protein
MLRTLLIVLAALGLCLPLTGCGGDGRLRTAGKVLKGGQPFIPKNDESVRVTFVPILADGTPPRDHYHAIFEPADATFWAAGKDLGGLPPGKYRVAIIYQKNKKDLMGGKFDENRSPFVFNIDSGTKELVIDLDSPPKG